jgi:hypothetical protein
MIRNHLTPANSSLDPVPFICLSTRGRGLREYHQGNRIKHSTLMRWSPIMGLV